MGYEEGVAMAGVKSDDVVKAIRAEMSDLKLALEDGLSDSIRCHARRLLQVLEVRYPPIITFKWAPKYTDFVAACEHTFGKNFPISLLVSLLTEGRDQSMVPLHVALTASDAGLIVFERLSQGGSQVTVTHKGGEWLKDYNAFKKRQEQEEQNDDSVG
jgi:hypothetical protein